MRIMRPPPPDGPGRSLRSTTKLGKVGSVDRSVNLVSFKQAIEVDLR